MPRTRFTEDEIALALRLAHEGRSAAEIDARIGRDADAVELVRVDEVSDAALAAIARDVFGAAAKIASIEPLFPLQQHGLPRRAGFTGNLLYRIRLRGARREWVFRFNRGFREDVYDQEAANYRRIADATGVRVPEIACIDRSRRRVPGAFMVLEFLHGDPWSYLAHPDNPDTSPTEKAAIRRRTGTLFATLHGVERPASDPLEETRQILWGLYRLRDAVAAGVVEIDPAALERCRAAIEAEPALRTDVLSVCFVDAEICFARAADGFELAFVCDAEWVAYRDRHADLVAQLDPHGPLWQLDRPLIVGDPDALARDPFFAGYRAVRDADFARLARLPPYHQLRLWGHALAEDGPPAAKEWLRRNKGPLVAELVARIGGG